MCTCNSCMESLEIRGDIWCALCVAPSEKERIMQFDDTVPYRRVKLCGLQLVGSTDDCPPCQYYVGWEEID